MRHRVDAGGRLDDAPLQPADARARPRRDDRRRLDEVSRTLDRSESERCELSGALRRARGIGLSEDECVLDARRLQEGEHLQVGLLQPDLCVEQHQHQLERLASREVVSGEVPPAADGVVRGKGKAVSGHVDEVEGAIRPPQLEEV